MVHNLGKRIRKEGNQDNDILVSFFVRLEARGILIKVYSIAKEEEGFTINLHS